MGLLLGCLGADLVRQHTAQRCTGNTPIIGRQGTKEASACSLPQGGGANRLAVRLAPRSSRPHADSGTEFEGTPRQGRASSSFPASALECMRVGKRTPASPGPRHPGMLLGTGGHRRLGRGRVGGGGGGAARCPVLRRPDLISGPCLRAESNPAAGLGRPRGPPSPG